MNVKELMAVVELKDIRRVGMLARLDRGPVPAEGATYDTAFDASVGATRSSVDEFTVMLAVQCRPRSAPHERPFARFLFKAAAFYRAPGAWSDEVLNQFAQTNGTIHLWPYAREFVQTASTQLGLHRILIPPFRLAPNRGDGPPGGVVEPARQ